MSKTISLNIPESAAEREAIRTAFCCSGCGKPSPNQIKPCKCATGVGFRIVDGKVEHCSFVEPDRGFDPILAAIMLAFAQQRGPIPDSDLDDEQPISLNILLTLGDVRRARRSLKPF